MRVCVDDRNVHVEHHNIYLGMQEQCKEDGYRSQACINYKHVENLCIHMSFYSAHLVLEFDSLSFPLGTPYRNRKPLLP